MSAELLSVTPSPSRDQDVFGKELRLTDAERKLLSGAGEIFLCKSVQVDSHSKKGDPTEPRNLVISSSRCYILMQNPLSKLETSFNFLRIQKVQCSEKKLSFHLSGEGKPREYHASRRDSVEIISLITAQLKNVFPLTSLDLLLKLTFEPDTLGSAVSQLRDELTGAMDRVDSSTIDGFLTSYAFLCDYFGVKYSTEVSWYLKNVYLAHGLREIKLSDFDHLPPKEFLPVVSSLRHNSFFEGIVDRDDKLLGEVVEELCCVLSSSRSIKTLILSNCGLKPENAARLAASLKNNHQASLTHLDLSETPLDEKAVEAVGSALESLSHGMHQLRLANCKITARGNTILANSMKQNKHMQYSLMHLDLSNNPLGPDPLGGLSFIQEPHTIATLKLSNCSLVLDTVVPVLNRGCTQHLSDLDLSHNTGKGKKIAYGPSVASGLQQFCSSSIAIRSLNLSGCRLTNSVVKSMVEGLALNPNVSSVTLNVSSNDLGGPGAQQMMAVVGRTSCLHQLNLSDCGLDQCMSCVIETVAQNKMLCHLVLGKNFGGKAVSRIEALQQLASLLVKEDCHLLSLCLGDSHLKEHTPIILEAVAENTSLAKINLSGNQMGSRGARCLAKALLCNYALTEVSWDRNETPLRGFQEVAAAMENNYTLRVMPLPLHDIARVGGKVEEHVQLIQRYLCRNHSDERLKVEMAARHRTRLLTATQQSSVIGRELVQLGDLLSWGQTQDSSKELVAEGSEVKELANSVMKLIDGLYSPEVESEQFQTINDQVKEVISQFMEQLFVEHIQAKTEKMVQKSISICGAHLSEEYREKLLSIIVHEKDGEFSRAKKATLRHALPEIVNHVSDTNLEAAASISELLVEHTLYSLEKINHKLFKLQKEIQAKTQQVPDSKISRNFTFRVQEDSSPTKKKKRVRRPDPDDDEIDLPSVPLETGPTLQHLGKTRPKPARMQRGRPSVKPTIQPIESTSNTKQDSTPTPIPVVSDITPSPKMPMKPPPVAGKKSKQTNEVKTHNDTAKEEKEKLKEQTPSALIEEELKEEQKKDEIDEVKVENVSVKSGGEERSTSEECEEHRENIQELNLPNSSSDEVDVKASSLTPLSPLTPPPQPSSPTPLPQPSSLQPSSPPPVDQNGATGDAGSGNVEEMRKNSVILDQERSRNDEGTKPSAEDVAPPHLGSAGEAQDVAPSTSESTGEVKESAPSPSEVGLSPSRSTPGEGKDGTPQHDSEASSRGSVKGKEKKRSSLSKLFGRSKDGDVSDTAPKRQSSGKEQKRESLVIANEWEVVEGPSRASQSPEVGKKPPVVKEKPRRAVDEGEGKKVPVTTPSQLTSILQKRASKSNESADSETSQPPKNNPSPAPRPHPSEEESPCHAKSSPSPAPKPHPSSTKSESPQVAPKTTPSPAPKPRPKPIRAKKTNDDKPTGKNETATSESEGSMNTLV